MGTSQEVLSAETQSVWAHRLCEETAELGSQLAGSRPLLALAEPLLCWVSRGSSLVLPGPPRPCIPTLGLQWRSGGHLGWGQE